MRVQVAPPSVSARCGNAIPQWSEIGVSRREAVAPPQGTRHRPKYLAARAWKRVRSADGARGAHVEGVLMIASTSSLLMALPIVAMGATGDKSAAIGPLDGAIANFQYGDWPHAFELLVPLADKGDCQAARLSLMMHARGARLFGGSFPATPAQCLRWHVLSDS